MARGIKRSYNELIAQIDKDILKHQEKISALKEKRAKLESEKRDVDLAELYKLMDEKNMSPDDVITIIKDK